MAQCEFEFDHIREFFEGFFLRRFRLDVGSVSVLEEKGVEDGGWNVEDRGRGVRSKGELGRREECLDEGIFSLLFVSWYTFHMKYFRVLLLVSFVGALFSALPVPSVQAASSGSGTIDTSTGWTGGFQEVKDNSGLSQKTVDVIVKGLMKWFLVFVGFISIIAFIIAGILYLTAAGDEKQIGTAKTAMKWSIVGVIVALMGYVVILAVDYWLNGSSSTV